MFLILPSIVRREGSLPTGNEAPSIRTANILKAVTIERSEIQDRVPITKIFINLPEAVITLSMKRINTKEILRGYKSVCGISAF